MRFIVQTTTSAVGNKRYNVLDLLHRHPDGQVVCVDCFDDDPWRHGTQAAPLAFRLASHLNAHDLSPRKTARREWFN